MAGGSAAGEEVRRHRAAPRLSCRARGRARRGRALGASGSQATESTTPIANSVVSSAVPPAETSGSGTPRTGKTPSTTPILTHAWPTTQTSTAAVTALANGCALRAAPVAGDREHDEEADHDDRADEAELLADDREDEVVVGRGQPRPLRRRVAEPHAEDPAVRERERAVLDLPAVRDVVLGAVSCRNAVIRRIRLSLETATIRRTRRPRQTTGRQQPEPHPDEEERAEQHARHDHHGAEVAAEEHEADRPAADEQDRHDAAA